MAEKVVVRQGRDYGTSFLATEPESESSAPRDPRLVTSRTGVDHTAAMKAWTARRLDELASEDLCGFVFKSRSPSSGMRQVKV